MALETRYRGYTINFVEDEENWRCGQLKLENPSLAALKRQLDSVNGEHQNAATVPVLVVIRAGEFVIRYTNGVVVEAARKTRLHRGFLVAVMVEDGDGRRTRKEFPANEIVPDTLEVWAMFDEQIAFTSRENDGLRNARMRRMRAYRA